MIFAYDFFFLISFQVMDKWNHWSSDVVRRERQRVRESSRTGGGLPSSTWVPSPCEERVLHVMGRTVVHGVPISGAEVRTPSSPGMHATALGSQILILSLEFSLSYQFHSGSK